MRLKLLRYITRGLRAVFTIQTIMGTRLFVGLYYNISPNIMTRFATRLYCVLWTIIVLLLYFSYQRVDWTNASLVISYPVTILMNLIFEGERFFNFLSKIRKVDDLLGIIIYDEIPISRLAFLYVILQKLLLYVNVSIKSSFPKVIHLIFSLLSLAISSGNLTRIMMFESLYHRMRVLRKRFERDLSPSRRFEEGEQVLIQNLKTWMVIYKKLLDTAHESDTPMKMLIFLDVVCVIPKVLSVIHEVFSVSLDCTSLLIILMELIMPFLPGIISELICCEVDKIKLSVTKQLLVFRGTNSRDAIKDAMKFFQYYPFKYTIWRLLNIDLTLILTTASLVTTYTLAMIQFAHFYN